MTSVYLLPRDRDIYGGWMFPQWVPTHVEHYALSTLGQTDADLDLYRGWDQSTADVYRIKQQRWADRQRRKDHKS
jgi:hypothetical protein